MMSAFQQEQMRREAEASTALDGETYAVDTHPVALPYAGTSGFSGSSTSEERARTQDADGTTGKRQVEVLQQLHLTQRLGRTVTELRESTGWHHGQVSAALSNLHKVGLIQRLTERRGKCQVYVLPEYVGGRETVAQGSRRAAVVLDTNEIAALIRVEAAIFSADEIGTSMIGVPTAALRLVADALRRAQ